MFQSKGTEGRKIVTLVRTGYCYLLFSRKNMVDWGYSDMCGYSDKLCFQQL